MAASFNFNQLKPNDVHVMLAKAINNRKNIIINPSGSIPREKLSQEKERAWEAVRTEMVNAGVQRFATRTWRTVRDVDWQHLRRRVVNKIAENLKLYQVPDKDLNEVSCNGKVKGLLIASFSWIYLYWTHWGKQMQMGHWTSVI
jgi:hypothetical protein